MFNTQEEIKKAETSELVAFYNKITGKDIKKFESRAAAESRIWKLVQSLPPVEESEVIQKSSKSKKQGEPTKRESYENRIIELLVKENPKREGSRAHKKFGILMQFDGKTLGEYRAQEGKHPELDGESGWPSTEIRWGLMLGLIKISVAKSIAA